LEGTVRAVTIESDGRAAIRGYQRKGTCKMRNETRNEIYRNETKFTETKRNRCETKRNGIIQNEIKPILTKQFLGERQDKN
jgi:hypothetical protein